jgi:hypothetical protein
MSLSPTDLSVRLPKVYAIGFVGDSSLADEGMCRRAIERFLSEQRGVADRILYGVSTLAVGGQLIFAESCIALGVPLRLLLPLAQDRFLSESNAPVRERFERVIDNAMSVEVAGSEESPDEGRYERGLQTVQLCQELLAVWDGHPAQTLGGTGEIVTFAEQMRRPVTWIHSETGAVQTIQQRGEQNVAPEEELNFLNCLPAAGTVAEVDSPTTLAESWLAKLDTNAAQLAPQVRRLAAGPIVCTALAALVSAAAQTVHASAAWMAAGGALLGLTAAVLPAMLRLGKRQEQWVRIRTAAEVSRSVSALWDTPVRYQVVGPEILPELNSMIRSLDFLKAEAGQQKKIGLVQFKERYLEVRLLDQMKYFQRQSLHSASMGRRYRLVSKVCAASAIVVLVWTFSSRYLMKMSHVASGGSWLPLVASALFQIATIAGALLVVNECERRERRYKEIHRSLADWDAELRAFHTWPPVIEVVSKIERALLVELLEWRSLLKNMKMPRN